MQIQMYINTFLRIINSEDCAEPLSSLEKGPGDEVVDSSVLSNQSESW